MTCTTQSVDDPPADRLALRRDCSHLDRSAGEHSDGSRDGNRAVAVIVAVQPHRADHALVSLLVSFTYVRNRSAHATQNRQRRLRIWLT
jgi:hypothetical protein